MFDPALLGESAPQARESPRGRPGAPVDVERLLSALRRRPRVLLGAFVGFAVLGAVAAKALVPLRYKAAATIVRDSTPQASVDASRTQKSVGEAMKLDNTLAEVRRRLSLGLTLAQMSKLVEVEGANESGLTTIRVAAGDPEAAVALANTFAAVFIDSRRELERARAKEALTVIAHDVEATHREVSAARAAHDAFRREHGIADLTAERQTSIELASRLRAESDLAGVDASGEEEKERALRRAERSTRAMIIIGERSANPAVVKLRESESDLATLRGRLAPDHPQILAHASQIEALRKEAARSPLTVETVLGPNPEWGDMRRGLMLARSMRAAAQKKHDALAELAQTARQRADLLSAFDGRSAELLAAVRSSETRLAELESERLKGDETVRSPSPGFHLAAGATRPDRAERSARWAVVVLAPLVGLGFGALFLVLRALSGLRVVSPTEAAYWTGAPVVGASPWPDASAALDDLVEDLTLLLSPQPHVAEDASVMLVVGAGDEESGVAPELAARLSSVFEEGGRQVVIRAVPRGTSDAVLRRAARSAHRVLLLVASDRHTAAALRGVGARLGRADGVGVVVTQLARENCALSDRVGDIRSFAMPPPLHSTRA